MAMMATISNAVNVSGSIVELQARDMRVDLSTRKSPRQKSINRRQWCASHPRELKSEIPLEYSSDREVNIW